MQYPFPQLCTIASFLGAQRIGAPGNKANVYHTPGMHIHSQIITLPASCPYEIRFMMPVYVKYSDVSFASVNIGHFEPTQLSTVSSTGSDTGRDM